MNIDSHYVLINVCMYAVNLNVFIFKRLSVCIEK